LQQTLSPKGLDSDDFKNNPGFNAGLKGDFPFGDIFSFETGVLLSTGGYKADDDILGIEYKVNLKTLNIVVPLTGKVGIDAGSVRFYGAFGPYVGFGLSGKAKSEVTVLGQTEKDESDIEWGSDEADDDLKRLDYGLTAGAGIEISTLQIGVTYGLGLANISTETDMGATINNRILGISATYYFGGDQ
jgi:hypothetical protein